MLCRCKISMMLCNNAEFTVFDIFRHCVCVCVTAKFIFLVKILVGTSHSWHSRV